MPMKKVLIMAGLYNYRSLTLGLVGSIVALLFLVWLVTTTAGSGEPLPDFLSVKIGIFLFFSIWTVICAVSIWGLWTLSKSNND